ncbi:tetratricopeptide repeat protein [Nannocystis sp.]|uniref:tetratricopeptide repeat protein n=1 Tax=Nannocystis sp. TaxID=1962667 RepID=UPI0024292D24|nr:tetratricopeptide repeat protein [Nannocystis sp.]MBK7826175.1 hypothetical protein [Nannocystis sp.]MBK9758308.1 hypothetical protein [Nannocystis sp.]
MDPASPAPHLSPGTAESPTPAPADPLRPGVVLAALLTLIGLVLLPQLGFGLVYDDGWTLVTNGFLRVPTELGALFSPEAVTRNIPDAFRPGLVLFDVLSYQLLGLDPRWHHAVSIALHLGVCAALAAWLRRLGAPLILWAGTMTLFGLLAIHAEAIAVVSFREDLLAALLGLLACTVASAAVRSRRAWPLAPLAALLSLGACAMKQSAAALPLLWLLAEALAPWQTRRPWPRLFGLAGALLLGAAALTAFTFWLYGGLSPYGLDNPRLFVTRTGLAPVLAMSTQIHLGYLQQIVLPFGLSPEYVDSGARWDEPATLLASAALLSLLLYGLARARARPLACLAIVGAFILALPTSNLAPMPNMRADRFMYLPSLPVCLGLATLTLAAGRRLATSLARPTLLLAPLAALAILQGAVLAGTAFNYRSNGQLWAVARALAPGSARAQASTGELLIASQNTTTDKTRRATVLARAEAHCIHAERLDPHYELPQLCFARLAAARQDWREARRRFAAALADSPDRNARILAGLAQTSLDLPNHSEDERRQLALAALERGLHEYPYSPELHDVAGQIFHRLGDPRQALEHYRRALTLAPERGEPLLAELALLLDLGLPVAAKHLLAAHPQTWLAADPIDRTALIARQRDALQLFAPTMILSADLVGVFPDEP